MENKIKISIVMPTYNSEETIGKALESIRRQSFPQDQLEILVVDGGSTDRTREIALAYNAILLDNPKRVPEIAKCIGIAHARGTWLIKQDSDEVYTDSNQVQKRYDFLQENPEVYCLLADVLEPDRDGGFSNAYLNYVGDPFTYIVNKNYYGSSVLNNKKYLFRKTELGNVYQYSDDDIMPIGDGGTTMINLLKLKELFGEDFAKEDIVCAMTNLMIQKTKYVGCIHGDTVKHYSKASLRQYLRKQKFKINNNLNKQGEAGFGMRAKYNHLLKRRRILFVLYCVTVVGPIIDSVRLAKRFSDWTMAMHVFYTYFIFFEIISGIVCKVLHIKRKEYGYG